MRVLSVLSSTKIRNRVERIGEHLTGAGGTTSAKGGEEAGREEGGTGRHRAGVVFLHGRPGDVAKLVTIAEMARGVLKDEEGKRSVRQYNQLVEMPPRPPGKKVGGQSMVEETVVESSVVPGSGLEGEGDGEGDGSEDAFEPLDGFEEAVNPVQVPRKVKTLGVFLTLGSIPELESREDVTVQTDETV